MVAMRTQGPILRKRSVAAMAVVALLLLGVQPVLAGLHQACHTPSAGNDPVHGCAVCAQLVGNPALPAAIPSLPAVTVASVVAAAVVPLEPAPALADATVRAPPHAS